MPWSDLFDTVERFLARPIAATRGGLIWTVGDVALAGAAVAAAFLVSWGLRALLTRHVGREPDVAAPGDRLHRVVHWVCLVVGAFLALDALHLRVGGLLDVRLFHVGHVEVTVMSVVVVAVILLGSLVASRVLRTAIRRSLRAETPQAEANVRALARLVHYAVVLVGVAVALPALGIEIGALLAVGGVFVVALGFAMKELTENFVSGVILLAERAIKPGDVLEVEGRVVRVTQMGIRTTMATTRDGEDLIIPNSTLVTSTVKNLTWRDSHFRIHAKVGVSYGSDLEVVFAALRACADALPWRMPEHEPRIYLTAFGDSAVEFEVIVWIADPWRSRQALSDLHRAVWHAIREAGVSIPFPQVDLHLDERAVAALANRPAG